jgi:N-acetylmuramoyl-L-alanine amidase
MKPRNRRGVDMVSICLGAALLAQAAGSAAWAETAAVPRDWDRCKPAQFRVVVDVGHTAAVPGALSARGVTEYEFNLRLSKVIERKLLESGFARTVLMVTDGPAQAGLAKRVRRANDLKADVFLSVHHDSVPERFKEKWEHHGSKNLFSDRFKGHSIFVSYDHPDRKGSMLFAKLLGEQLKAQGLHYSPHYTETLMGGRRRELVDGEAGVYRFDMLHVLRATEMPAVLLEAGLIINRDEELLLASPDHQTLISTAVTEAVEAFCVARAPQPLETARRPGKAKTSAK